MEEHRPDSHLNIHRPQSANNYSLTLKVRNPSSHRHINNPCTCLSSVVGVVEVSGSEEVKSKNVTSFFSAFVLTTHEHQVERQTLFKTFMTHPFRVRLRLRWFLSEFFSVGRWDAGLVYTQSAQKNRQRVYDDDDGVFNKWQGILYYRTVSYLLGSGFLFPLSSHLHQYLPSTVSAKKELRELFGPGDRYKWTWYLNLKFMNLVDAQWEANKVVYSELFAGCLALVFCLFCSKACGMFE